MLIQRLYNFKESYSKVSNKRTVYAYSFWKVCHPVRLLQTVRLLETLE